MAYTQSQVDALKAAAAKGVTRLRMNGEELQFDSLAELRKQIRIMEDDLSGGGAGGLTVGYVHRAGRGL